MEQIDWEDISDHMEGKKVTEIQEGQIIPDQPDWFL